MMNDIFEEDEAEPEFVETERVRGNEARLELDSMESMLSNASKISNAATQLDLKRIEKAAAFIEYADKNGFSSEDIVKKMNKVFDIATEKKDSRALTRLIEIINKVMIEPATDFNRNAIQLQQNNIKMLAAKGDAPPGEVDAANILKAIPESLLTKLVAEHLQKLLDET